MAPFNVDETCDCTATSAKRFGRYLRARAKDTLSEEEGGRGAEDWVGGRNVSDAAGAHKARSGRVQPEKKNAGTSLEIGASPA
jgi:hypothetical protein